MTTNFSQVIDILISDFFKRIQALVAAFYSVSVGFVRLVLVTLVSQKLTPKIVTFCLPSLFTLLLTPLTACQMLPNNPHIAATPTVSTQLTGAQKFSEKSRIQGQYLISRISASKNPHRANFPVIIR